MPASQPKVAINPVRRGDVIALATVHTSTMLHGYTEKYTRYCFARVESVNVGGVAIKARPLGGSRSLRPHEWAKEWAMPGIDTAALVSAVAARENEWDEFADMRAFAAQFRAGG